MHFQEVVSLQALLNLPTNFIIFESGGKQWISWSVHNLNTSTTFILVVYLWLSNTMVSESGSEVHA